jgi:hypothetical protein
MPTLGRFFSIVITMNLDDHPPPHFHARYAEHEAVVRLDTLEAEAGHLPRRVLGLVLERAAEHRAELWDNSDRVHSSRPIRSITPLD